MINEEDMLTALINAGFIVKNLNQGVYDYGVSYFRRFNTIEDAFNILINQKENNDNE